MKTKLILCVVIALFTTPVAYAAKPRLAQHPDFLREYLFPPQLLIRHGEKLGLSRPERREILEQVKAFEGKVLDVRFDMSEEVGRLSHILEGSPVNPEEALEQAQRVMALETRMKLMHLEFLIRLKNDLSAEQIERLKEMQSRRPIGMSTGGLLRPRGERGA